MEFNFLFDKIVDKTGLTHFWEHIQSAMNKQKTEIIGESGQAVAYTSQTKTEADQQQARTNIGVDYAADEEVLALILEEGLVQAYQTEDGSVLTDSDGAVFIL